MSVANELKRLGNDAFTQKRYGDALTHYREAIAALSPADRGAPAQHTTEGERGVLLAQLHANASAAELEVGDAHAALEAAATSVSLAPNWSKAYLRKAAALTRLGRHREACDTLAVAKALDFSSALARRLHEESSHAADAQDRSSPIDSPDRFCQVFRHVGDMRLRLATLAHGWNLLSCDERSRVLRAFLEIVGGPPAVDEALPADDRPLLHIRSFRDAPALHPLPMDNYADLAVPPTWISFLQRLPPSAPAPGPSSESPDSPVVELVKRLWDLLSATEQGLVIEDMRSFYSVEPAQDAPE